jgi:hypothetical protein
MGAASLAEQAGHRDHDQEGGEAAEDPHGGADDLSIQVAGVLVEVDLAAKALGLSGEGHCEHRKAHVGDEPEDGLHFRVSGLMLLNLCVCLAVVLVCRFVASLLLMTNESPGWSIFGQLLPSWQN